MFDDDNGQVAGILTLLTLTILCLFFIILITDYYSVYTIKETIDIEFKNVVMTEAGLNLTDEFTSDYIARFEDKDQEKFTNNLKTKFISHMKTSKGYDISVDNLIISYPSERTITFAFDGSFKFSPMIGKGTLTFDMPAKSRTRVIRVDDYEAETDEENVITDSLEDVTAIADESGESNDSNEVDDLDDLDKIDYDFGGV